MNEKSEQKDMCNIDYLFKRKSLKNDNLELRIHKDIADYIKKYYPSVYFISDPLGLHVFQSIKNTLIATNSNHKHLDIPILKRSVCLKYCGLILEVKKETPFLKDGLTLKKQPEYIKVGSSLVYDGDHLEKQFQVMQMLRLEGFKCEWCWSLDQAIEILNSYLGKPIVDHLKSIMDGSPYLK